MREIKLLSKSISDKIAAGEVVERPLSVVKELVENAIDAGASAVSISITDGGVGEICVTDNGIGIAAGDVKLAFEKHATSKISTIRDLGYISTQGFRGEALSSIAAVSVVDMKTKRRSEEMGTHIRISGGRFDYARPVGLPDGTAVTVSNLFFNVPARLKFLKKASQEAAYVSDLVSRYILAFPEISFHYTSQGKTVYHSPGNGDLKSAVYCVYGSGIVDNISYVEHEAGGVNVSGYVSRPGTVMKNRRLGSVFVNRRYVRSTTLHDMVRSAYGETLVKGEFPFFALNITLSVSAVDVNVHPNKLQVRFHDIAAVEHVVKEAVSQACRKIHGQVDMTPPEKPQIKKTSVEMQPPSPVAEQAVFFSGFSKPALREETQIPNAEQRGISAYEMNVSAEEDFAADDTHEDTDNAQQTAHASAADRGVLPDPVDYRLIGCFGKTYILAEAGESMLIIDQHAAHERLLYDQFKKSQSVMSQPLLMPHVMSVSHAQKNMIDENIEIFNSLGFDITPFGMLEYKISAVPSIAGGASADTLINDAMGEITQYGGNAVLNRESVIRASCRSAVKAGDPLGETALQYLLDEFLKTNAIPTCPHGRPIITVITKKQLEKSFKRIV